MKKYSKYPTELIKNRCPNVSSSNKELNEYVKPIVQDIARRGDEAVSQYTEKFDKVTLHPTQFKVTQTEIQEAYKQVSPQQIEALEESKRRLELVEKERLKGLSFTVSFDSVDVKSIPVPFSHVGCYVPGGKAAYPSSVLMNVVPAKVAGVEEVIVCTPPGKNGMITPLTIVAADVCGVEEIFKVGGIQAVSAMAYGTKMIPRVEKIVGPGNKYVTTAKKLVSDRVAIDKPAGPSEILILADETASPRFIARDMISQAEHGPGGISGLVSVSKKLVSETQVVLEELIPTVPRKEEVEAVLNENGFMFNCSKLEEGIRFVNDFAPEHLELVTKDNDSIVDKINTAGLILLGDYTPVSSTDYCMGVNHVLPTEGYGKISGGITVLDFVKIINIVEAKKAGLDQIRKHVKAFSVAEGLPNHCDAVEVRFRQ